MKTAKFIYLGREVSIGKFDPSKPSEPIKKDWDELEQEVFDQISDTQVFTEKELQNISDLSSKDFLKNIVEENEVEGKYNRARAIYEYKAELLSAIEGGRPTLDWAVGLDALRSGETAENYNY